MTRPDEIASQTGAKVVNPGTLEELSILQKAYRIITHDQMKYIVAGGIAGGISRTAVSPLERVKILLQLQTGSTQDMKYKGSWGTLVTIWKEEGWIGYFKGNGTNVVRIVPYSAIQFASYEEFKRLFKIPTDPRKQTPLKRLTAGACAGMVAATGTYPLDLIRTRLAAQGEGALKKYRNITHCFFLVMKEEGGPYALFRGLSPSLMGVAPYLGLNFLVFETSKGYTLQYLDRKEERGKSAAEIEEMRKHHKDNLPVPWKLFCGCVAGAISQQITYPLDVIRRRLQMMGTTGEMFKYKSTWHAATTIVQNEGVYGLFRGSVANLLKVAPAIGIQFCVYEVCRSLMFGEKIRWVS